MRISRKMEHVQHALQIGQSGEQGLSDVKFVHHCIPETSLASISLETKIGDLKLSSPIIINAMTGGSPETEEINRELATVAREFGLAMAVGSQMAALKNREVAGSYQIVRKVNPQGLIFANLGSEATLEQAQQAVEMIDADALQIHLNVMQELIMPEGDRDFSGMLNRIETIVSRLAVPVIVKEVGFGLMGESAKKLREIGVAAVDVGGSGGTNFAAIENARRIQPLDWLNDWGHPTSIALFETLQYFPADCVIASGGIRNGLEICKALAIGSSAVGLAGSLLKALRQEGTEGLRQTVQAIMDEVRIIMTAVGADSVNKLWRAPLVVSGETAYWCEVRGIDTARYAKRGRAD